MALKPIEILIKAAVDGMDEIKRLIAGLDETSEEAKQLKQHAEQLSAAFDSVGKQQALIDSFVKLKQSSSQAADALEEAQRNAQELGKALAQTAAPTKTQIAEFERARKAVGDAKQAYQEINRQLDQTRTAMASAGLSTKDLAAQQVQLNKAAQQTQAGLETLTTAAREAASKAQALEASTKAQATASTTAAKATDAHTTSIKQMDASAGSLASELGSLQNTIATVFGVQIGTGLLSDLAKTADAYNNLSARIKITTGEGAAFEAAMAGVQRVAIATRSSLEETAGLYNRLAEAGKTLKLTQDQVLGLTQTINQAIQISGGSAESSQAAIQQLNQALQSGVLRGEEFNSVMEQSPRLAKALADGLGVGVGKLREMAEAGRLTTDVVIAALRGQSEAVEKEFAKLPATVGGALQNLSTAWTVYIGETDKATGASKAAADAINALSSNLKDVAGFLLDAGQAAGALFALKMAQSFLGIGQAAKSSGSDIATNTLATNNNTKAATDNALATKNNAAAQKEHADAARQDAAATDTDTAATQRNTKATNDNALGTRATGSIMQSYSGAIKEATDAKEKATQGAGLLSKAMGTLGDAAKGAVGFLGGIPGIAVMVLSNAKDIGTAIGETAGKFALWATGQKSLEQSTKELTAAQEKEAAAAKAVAEAREKQAAADKAAADAKFGLNDRAKELIAQFDDLIKKGDSASDAISKIGKDFDLSTQPGIQAAAGVLDKLAADGKITAQQFQDAWAQALDGQDLAKFETNFRAMLLNLEVAADKAGKEVEAAIARGASDDVVNALRLKAEQAAQAVQEAGKRMATVFDVTLNEAIRRTGLDMDLLAQGMGKASISAINDADKLINSLEQLKAKGIDTGRVLTASLSKAIDTADGQKALDLVKQKIEEVRSTLGNKIADGLLDQAKTKADELKGALEGALPGIQSVAEAMKQLGITTDAALKQSADGAKQAYDAVRTSGTASAREVGEAFKAAADKAIAANNGIIPSWVQAEASLRGYKIATDAAGKSTLELASAMGTAKGAAMDFSMSLEEIAKKYSDAGAAALAAKGQFLAAAHAQKNADTANSSITKKQDTDKDGFKLGSNGQRQTQFMPYENYIIEGAQSQGLTDQQANELLQKFWQNGQPTGWGAGGQDWFSAVNEAISKQATDNFKRRADAENALKQLVANGRTISDREAKSFEDLGLTVPDSIRSKPPAPAPQAPRAPTPAPRAPTPAPTPAPQAPAPQQGGGRMAITAAPTYVSNINLPGVGSARAMFDNPGDQASMESMLRALTSAAGVAQ
ncbi:MAG: tape measure protein [Giesbergeria sp.]|nr:tape measure protein [Giesbergeria sp.]